MKNPVRLLLASWGICAAFAGLLQCETREEPSCADLIATTWAEVQATVAGADHVCANDSDCTLGDYHPVCLVGCGTVVALASSATDAVQQAVDMTSEHHCPILQERKCESAASPCAINGAPVAVCRQNLCAVDVAQ